MAVDFWRLSLMAEQGDAAAQYCLGVLYQRGGLMYKGIRAVPPDMAEALKWLRKAAEQGYAKAQCYLGIMTESARACRRTTCRPTPGSVLPPLMAINRPSYSGISSPNYSKTDPRPSCPVSTHVAVGSMHRECQKVGGIQTAHR